MHRYLVTLRVKSQMVKTIIFADSTIHARLLGEWHYGIGAVVSAPVRLDETQVVAAQTPAQARIKSLQSQAARAKQVYRTEKARQKVAQAQQQLVKTTQASVKTA